MSSALFVSPLRFFSNPKAHPNPLRSNVTHVSATVEALDTNNVCSLIAEISDKLIANGIDAKSSALKMEKKCISYIYEAKGEAVLAAHTMSFHNFVDENGTITRRLVVLYPCSPFRQEELPKKQIEEPLLRDESDVEIVDLRGFEKSNRFLEGTASLVFSACGKYVYMARSSRSNEEVLDVLCSPENLNIPPENRFVFEASLPAKNGFARAEFTNVLGWCGWGICAWCLDYLRFDTPEEQERFYTHLETSYEVVVELTPRELMSFAGTAFEVTSPDGRCTLFLPETARKGFSIDNYKALKAWYGDKIIPVFTEVLERRCGCGIPSIMIASKTHGSVPPNSNQVSTLRLLGIPASTI